MSALLTSFPPAEFEGSRAACCPSGPQAEAVWREGACSSVEGNQPTCPPPKSIGCPLREGMATSLREAKGKEELSEVSMSISSQGDDL